MNRIQNEQTPVCEGEFLSLRLILYSGLLNFAWSCQARKKIFATSVVFLMQCNQYAGKSKILSGQKQYPIGIWGLWDQIIFNDGHLSSFFTTGCHQYVHCKI